MLLVEDELIIALELQAIIEQEGYEVAGPFRDVSKALTEIEAAPPRMALLDANIGGISSSPIAEALQHMGIPFAVITGYPHLREEHESLRRAPYLRKPYRPAEIMRLLQSLLLRQSGT